MVAYEASARLRGGFAQPAAQSAYYLHGRSAKSMALWRGWDAYNAFLRATVRRPGGAASLAVDPVASLSSPFTGPELLNVVRAAADVKLAETATDGGGGGGLGGPSAAARRALETTMLRRGGERLTVGLVSSYFRDHNLLRLTRSLFLKAVSSTQRRSNPGAVEGRAVPGCLASLTRAVRMDAGPRGDQARALRGERGRRLRAAQVDARSRRRL